jgi:periplasmic copper chaperone A
MKTKLVCFMLILAVALSGCANVPVGPIQIDSHWVRAAATGGNTAAFMLIKNTSGQDDKLIKAESSVSGKIGLMDTQKKDDKMQMVDVDSIVVPANGQVELKSGSFHVMFMGLTRDLNEGDKIQLKLTFEKGGTVQLDVPVKKVAPSMP